MIEKPLSEATKDQTTEHQAVSIWEKGVQKERDGSMTDAIRYYRQALKIDEKVEKTYRKKLHEEWLVQQKLAELQLSSPVMSQATAVDTQEANETGDDGEAEMPPCWIFEKLPNDLLLKVIAQVILMSGESWLNLSLTCSRFNELSFHNSLPFQTFASYMYERQYYDTDILMLDEIEDLDTLDRDLWDNNCEKMLKDRPYVKFEGVYISIVNYLRHGANAEGSSSLISPIQMITYYRYFRFYPDGRCLRLVTTDEPSQVVAHFSMESPPCHSDICYWGLGLEGNLGHLAIRRSGEKYSFVEELQIKSHGRRRHHRLAWIKSLVIDNEGNVSECSLRNEKPFSFSRVRSFAPSD